MLHLVRSHTRTAVALVAVGTLTALASPTVPSAHAARLAALRAPGSTATYINPAHTYRVSYPAGWSRRPGAGVDVLLVAPDGNVDAVTLSISAPQGLGPHPLRRYMLQDYVKEACADGSPVGQATYFALQGGAMHVGTRACHWPDGTVGRAVLAFTCRHNRVYLVGGMINNLRAPTVTRDERQLHGILLSLQVA
jgi:hypothetical protein